MLTRNLRSSRYAKLNQIYVRHRQNQQDSEYWNHLIKVGAAEVHQSKKFLLSRGDKEFLSRHIHYWTSVLSYIILLNAVRCFSTAEKLGASYDLVFVPQYTYDTSALVQRRKCQYDGELW